MGHCGPPSIYPYGVIIDTMRVVHRLSSSAPRWRSGSHEENCSPVGCDILSRAVSPRRAPRGQTMLGQAMATPVRGGEEPAAKTRRIAPRRVSWDDNGDGKDSRRDVYNYGTAAEFRTATIPPGERTRIDETHRGEPRLSHRRGVSLLRSLRTARVPTHVRRRRLPSGGEADRRPQQQRLKGGRLWQAFHPEAGLRATSPMTGRSNLAYSHYPLYSTESAPRPLTYKPSGLSSTTITPTPYFQGTPTATRPRPITPGGRVNKESGIRQFIVGTGGNSGGDETTSIGLPACGL